MEPLAGPRPERCRLDGGRRRCENAAAAVQTPPPAPETRPVETPEAAEEQPTPEIAPTAKSEIEIPVPTASATPTPTATPTPHAETNAHSNVQALSQTNAEADSQTKAETFRDAEEKGDTETKADSG